MYNIAIIGAGQIGSRHLQGLAGSLKQMKIYLIDPNNDALSLAKQRFQEIENFAQKSILCHNNIDHLPKKIDLGIIATTANVRREIIELILDNCKINNLILEKIVFQNPDDFVPIKKLFIENKVKSWVYCGRRSSLFYQNLKKELIQKKISITVKGNEWGLACNGIHMIDLFVFLTESSDIEIDISGLENIIFNSKRSGFKELRGIIEIENSRGDTLKLIDSNKLDDSFKIFINTNDQKYDIFETKNFMLRYKLGDQPTQEHIEIEKVSKLTGNIVDKILENGKSDLPSFNECMEYHIPMLDAFNKHISKVNGKIIKSCPIT